MKVGNLYKCPLYYIFLYPTKECIDSVAFESDFDESRAALHFNHGDNIANDQAKWLSGKFNETISFIKNNEIFMILEKKNYIKVLYQNKIGWINKNWIKLKEVK